MRSIHSLPGHDEPQVVEVPDLQAGPGQVLIQTLAAAVNPVDVFVASDAGRGAVNAGERLGLGWDVSGRVLEVGDRVTTIAVGDVVAGVDDAMVGENRAQADLVAARRRRRRRRPRRARPRRRRVHPAQLPHGRPGRRPARRS